MERIAVLKDYGNDNDSYLKMWRRAFAFWGIRNEAVYPDALTQSYLSRYGMLLLTGIDHIPAEGVRTLDKYVEEGGRLLISGNLPAGFEKYFGGMRVKKTKRGDVQRCVRIKQDGGFMEWEDGAILFFTNTKNCGGLDYTADEIRIADAGVPAVSTEMRQSHEKAGLWEGWRDTSDPAVIKVHCGMGEILYTPFAVGAMEGLEKPHSADSIEYLHPKRNDGLYLFIRNLLEYLAGSEKLQYAGLWPDNARCAVCVTGDVHDYTGIAGREDREWKDMLYNFGILEEYGLGGKAAYYVCGEVARKHPETIRQGLERGFELCPHTWRETQYAIEKWDYQAQRQDIIRCIDAFEKAAPGYDAYKKGFRTHGYQSDGVTRQVLKDIGYEYIADMQAWETNGRYNPLYPEKLIHFAACPQFGADGEGDAGELLEIPDTYANDHFAYRIMKLSPPQALDFWKREFDRYYRLGGLFQACLHPYISLKEAPERENTYRGLLEYILSHRGVSFMTMGELNRWWREREKSCVINA